MVLMSSLKESKNASNEVVVRCPHCGQRLMGAEYVLAKIKCPRCKNQVALRVENKPKE
jgi:phage FluMu protein Com